MFAASGIAAACSKVRLAGFASTRSTETATYSAKAPGASPYTSSPMCRPVTAEPTASTVPAKSVPRIVTLGRRQPRSADGRATYGSPRRTCQSRALTEAARTLTSTW